MSLGLRDRYRYFLSPGGPNRATCAGISAFHQEIISVTLFDWPDEVFDAFGSDGGKQKTRTLMMNHLVG